MRSLQNIGHFSNWPDFREGGLKKEIVQGDETLRLHRFGREMDGKPRYHARNDSNEVYKITRALDMRVKLEERVSDSRADQTGGESCRD